MIIITRRAGLNQPVLGGESLRETLRAQSNIFSSERAIRPTDQPVSHDRWTVLSSHVCTEKCTEHNSTGQPTRNKERQEHQFSEALTSRTRPSVDRTRSQILRTHESKIIRAWKREETTRIQSKNTNQTVLVVTRRQIFHGRH